MRSSGRAGRRRREALAAALWVALLGGCRLPLRPTPAGPAAEGPVPASAAVPDVDPTFVPRSAGQARDGRKRPLAAAPLAAQVSVLHVQVPAEQAPAAEAVWNHLRQDVLDADTRYRLALNGIRVGIGSVRWWEPIRLVLDAIPGHRVAFSQPLRVPQGFPVQLELSEKKPQETIFVVASDGVLSGQTFTDARHVLRIELRADPGHADRVRVRVVPEIHRDHEGWRWVRTESGLWQVPDVEQTALVGAGFEVSLGPGQLLLLAATPDATMRGLVGPAFFRTLGPEGAYNSYVFIRPEVISPDATEGVAAGHDSGPN